MMTHQEIQEGEIIERYVLRQLAPDERRAFQEHYFECEECFEQAQTMAGVAASVRQTSRQGLLAESAAEPVVWWASLFKPAFGLAMAAVVLAVALGWLMFRQLSAPRQELAHEQQPSPPPVGIGTPGQNTATGATPAPESNELPKLPKPEDQPDLLAQNSTPEGAPGQPPAVLLESSRAASPSSNQLTLPATASSAIMRIEVEPGSPFTSFQFQVFDSSKRLVTTVTSGKASALGSVAVLVPTQQLQNGTYLIKCYGAKDGQRELIGEYDLRVSKP